MSKEQYSNFYEAEHVDIQLSHLDFSSEEKFDYTSETKEINEYLLSKRWDFESNDKSSTISITNDIKMLNEIFGDVFKQFHPRVDGVELFHLITAFYNLEPKDCFSKLLSKYRKILYEDLESRIGTIRNVKSLDRDQNDVKLTFKSLFNK